MAITRATNLAGLGTVFDALTDGGGLSLSGISTFKDLLFVGSGSTSGIENQPLQVIGDAYISGSIGLGTTGSRGTSTPTNKLIIYSDSLSDSTTASPLAIVHPKNTIGLYIGDSPANSVAGYGQNDYASTIRFNGSGVSWGDISYYPKPDSRGHFRFTRSGSTVNTAPTATVGVGTLYAVWGVGVGTAQIPGSVSYFKGNDSSLGIINIQNNYPYYGGSNFTTGNLYVGTQPGYNARGLVSRVVLSTGDGGQTYLDSIAMDTNGTAADFVISTRNSSAPTEKLRVTYDGKVGIATTNPAQKLDVEGNVRLGTLSAATDFTDSGSTGTRQLTIGANNAGDALLVTHASGYGVGYFGYEAGGDRLIIACDNGSGNNKIDFSVNAGTTANGTTDNINGIAPAMRIDASGKVGIGTTLPGASLHVSGGMRSDDFVEIRADDAQLYFENAANDRYWRQELVGSASSPDFAFDYYNGGASAASEKLRLLNGGGITFNGDTATANALDDYEEGTFTGTLNWHTDVTNTSTTNASANYTGYYLKIGSLVYFYILTTTSATTNYVYKSISGLPFTVATAGSRANVQVRGGRFRYSASTTNTCLFFSSLSGTTAGLNTEQIGTAFSGWIEVVAASQNISVWGTYHTFN